VCGRRENASRAPIPSIDPLIVPKSYRFFLGTNARSLANGSPGREDDVKMETDFLKTRWKQDGTKINN
jgi:hypothetical protein